VELNRYQELAQRTQIAKTPGAKLENGCLGLAGEVGECCDILKKHLFQGHELDRDHIVEELGDVMWYIAETASALNVTLEDVARYNIEKLRARYPDGFDPERSIHRVEYERVDKQC
jgi:NTP pyrophosphatase (non-canonical NTP hydrolase)